MLKKLFALAGVTALTGAVVAVSAAGCSSTTETTETTDSGTTDGGKKEGGGVGEDEDAGACPANVALTAADLDGEIGWKKAAPSPGACSQGDLTQLEANFKDDGIQSYFDLGKSVSDACKACVFAKDTDETWGPIVGSADDNGQTGFINFGACFGSIEGDACGKALQYEQFCYNVACNECSTTTTERQSCVEAAGSDGMCKDFGSTTGNACPDIQNTAKKCNTVFDGIKTLCGSGAGDGGAD